MTHRIVGVIRISDFHPCFAIPVSRSETEAGYWQQVRGISERVISFSRVPEADLDSIQFIETDVITAVGREFIHAFIERKGGLLIGSADDLRIPLMICAADPHVSSAVKIEIYGSLNQLSDEIRARHNLFSSIARDVGEASARGYLDTSAKLKLWDILIDRAIDDNARHKIRDNLRDISAHISRDGDVEFSLGSISQNDLLINIDDLTKWLSSQFSGIGNAVRMDKVDLSGLPHSEDPTIVTVVEAVKRSPRQEERIAVAIRSVILYPKVAREALARYKDPARMAASFLDIIEAVSRDFPKLLSESERAHIIAPLVKVLFSDAYPRRRGAILYYMAAHLSDFRPIADEIRRCLASTRSQAVEEYRKDIEFELRRDGSSPLG